MTKSDLIIQDRVVDRICYGMDIEPKYVAVTLERMSGMGLDPRLTDGHG